MTPEELKAIEERLSASRHWWGRSIKVGQLNDDIAALIAGYKELEAEVKQLKDEACRCLTGQEAHKRLDNIEEEEPND